MVNTKQGESGVKHIKKKINPSRKGDMAEHYAITWLWDQGYEVFQNAGCSGPVDMVAMDKKGKTVLIDVKHFIKDKRWNGTWTTAGNTRSKKQIKMGVKLLGFNPETRELRFVEHKE